MKKILIFLILMMTSFLGFSQSENSRFKILVDSTNNLDTIINLTVILKPNHGASSFGVLGQYGNLCTYQLSAYRYLTQPTVNTISADTFVYSMPTIGNGTYLYIVTLNNVTSNNILQIFSHQNTRPIKIVNPGLTVDSAINNDNNFKLRVTLPTISNVGKIQIMEVPQFSTVPINISTQLSFISDPPTINEFTIYRPPGTYYFKALLRRRAFLFPTLDTCETKLLPADYNLKVVVNPPPVVPSCAPSNLIILNDQTTKFRYRFTLNSNCPNQTKGYEARFYRLLDTDNLDAQNPNLSQNLLPNLKTAKVQYKNVTDIETLTSSRITLTQQEINQGFFERDAFPKILYFGWYRIDIVCTTCTYPNKLISKYVYIYL